MDTEGIHEPTARAIAKSTVRRTIRQVKLMKEQSQRESRERKKTERKMESQKKQTAIRLKEAVSQEKQRSANRVDRHKEHEDKFIAHLKKVDYHRMVRVAEKAGIRTHRTGARKGTIPKRELYKNLQKANLLGSLTYTSPSGVEPEKILHITDTPPPTPPISPTTPYIPSDEGEYGDTSDHQYRLQSPDTETDEDDTGNLSDRIPTPPGGKISRNDDEVGLYDTEINRMMIKYPSFVGAWAIDEMNNIPVKKRQFGFILNTKRRNDPEAGHWIACFIDPIHEKSVEYYDSFADQPSEEFMKGIKQIIVDKLDPSYYLKFKVNKIKEQDERSVSCGWHVMRFLINRFNGVPFKECTKFSDVRNSENKVKKMKKKFKKFGYI